MSTSYHPETDGSSERSNKTMIEALRHYVNLRHSDWADHLIHVEAAMNNSVNATTGKTPTELVYGTPPRLFPSVRDLAKPNLDIPAVSDYIQQIQDNIAFARDHHAEAKTKRLPMQTGNGGRNRITRLETKFIWRPRIYGYGSRRRAEVQSFILDMLAHSKSQRPNQKPRTTLSNYRLNFGFTPKSMLDD